MPRKVECEYNCKYASQDPEHQDLWPCDTDRCIKYLEDPQFQEYKNLNQFVNFLITNKILPETIRSKAYDAVYVWIDTKHGSDTT